MNGSDSGTGGLAGTAGAESQQADFVWSSTGGNEFKNLTSKRKRIAAISGAAARDPMNYRHVQNTVTVKEPWDSLKTTIQDSGYIRELEVLQHPTGVKLVDYSINMNYGHGSARDPDASGYNTCAKILQDVKRPDGPVGIESGWAFLWNASIRQPSYRDNLYVM